MGPIQMIPVESSNLSAIGYDEDTEALRVEFHDGSAYLYTGVDKSVYVQLLTATSKGVFFRKNIRDSYSNTKES